jgi:twitching motility two-component system response regulator PilH
MARVLIVDDDGLLVQTLVRVLHEFGHHETRVARSASDALRAAVEFLPAITFLDIELPDMGGYELAKQLHQHPQLQQMRLIALTDKGHHATREHARASGFERYIVKPITEAAVREVLEALT